jgi:hypothetical protein
MLNYYVTEEADLSKSSTRVLASITVEYEIGDEKVRSKILKEIKRSANALNERLEKVLADIPG